MSGLRFFSFLFPVLVLSGPVAGADWPTFNHDNHRSGVTAERLEMPLSEAWVFKSRHRPQPAWPEPARQDYFHHHEDLRSTVFFDRAFQVVGEGDTVYFGSSADDKVYALDARTGRERWTFFAEGPIRLAPVVAGGRLYFGCDDGFVYCLSARDGSLLWKYSAAEQKRIVPGNGRMISMQCVRTGLVVDRGIVYLGAGLFPNQGTYLVALRAEDGSVEWKRQSDISAQGYIAASDERLYVPTGRTSPAMFSRGDGAALGALPSAGGAYVLLSERVLVTGPGRGPKELHAGDVETKDRIATFGGLRMLVRGEAAYMQSEEKLAAFDRGRYLALSRKRNDLSGQAGKIEEELKKLDKETDQAQQLQESLGAIKTEIGQVSEEMEGCYLWTVGCSYPHSMIMAGEVLFLGGENKVAAFSAVDGREIWNSEVEGTAYGLSVANGGLYVSTDKGRIHCFRSGVESGTKMIVEAEKAAYPQDDLTELYAEAARDIVKQSGIDKGYCLVLDSGRGRLAYELARQTDLKIVGVEKDPRQVAAARRLLDEAGLYGRVVIHQGSSEVLPYVRRFANLVVSDGALAGGKLPVSAKEVFELVRAYGGAILLGQRAGGEARASLERWGKGAIDGWTVTENDKIIWGRAERGRPPGAGEWTHTYADAGNTACSGDELVGGSMAIQWFGRPGPREMIDRHHRNVPPLFKDGRLYVPGDCVIFAVDAYNGTIQWKVSVPNSRRLGVFLDCGNMAVDDELLYVVAEDKCYGFDVQTGRRSLVHTMRQLTEGATRDWGYLALSGDILFGSACRQGASYAETSYDADIALWYRNMKLVVSEYLFGMEKGGGRWLWEYRDGLILNTTIAIGDGRVYFVETNSPKALADELGRVPVNTLFDGGARHLVALEAGTGGVIYRRQIETNDFEEPVYLNYAEGVVLLSGSRLVGDSIRYHYEAFDAETGQTRWSATHDSGLAKDGGHGEYNRHPTIVADTVYAWPYAYELASGRLMEGWKFDRRGHGCGGVSASARCLFWRGGNPWMYDFGAQSGARQLSSVTRPGCWINIIPAGGLVLIPEASSGCTCGFSLQTSMAFAPSGVE